MKQFTVPCISDPYSLNPEPDPSCFLTLPCADHREVHIFAALHIRFTVKISQLKDTYTFQLTYAFLNYFSLMFQK